MWQASQPLLLLLTSSSSEEQKKGEKDSFNMTNERKVWGNNFDNLIVSSSMLWKKKNEWCKLNNSIWNMWNGWTKQTLWEQNESKRTKTRIKWKESNGITDETS